MHYLILTRSKSGTIVIPFAAEEIEVGIDRLGQLPPALSNW